MNNIYATFGTPDIAGSPHQFLKIPGQPQAVYLGNWPLGQPSGPDVLADTPPVMPPDEADPAHMKADAAAALRLSNSRPRQLWETFGTLRAAVVDVEAENKRLRDEGFTPHQVHTFLRSNIVDRTIRGQLAAAVTTLQRIEAEADEAERLARQTFPGEPEDPMRAALNDSAIVVRLGELSDEDLRTLKAGDMPAKLRDTRTLQALHRTPAAAHAIPAEVLAQALGVHARRVAPQTMGMVDHLRKGVEACRVVGAQLAAVCAMRGAYSLLDVLVPIGGAALFMRAVYTAGHSDRAQDGWRAAAHAYDARQAEIQRKRGAV